MTITIHPHLSGRRALKGFYTRSVSKGVLACRIEHSRRSPTNFVVSTIAALIAYAFREKNPSLNIRVNELEKLLPAVV
jgi:hypothetical protein